MVPFPFLADMGETILEDVAYLTDVQEAYDTTEQRIQLRSIPRRALEYSTVFTQAREASHAMSLLYGWREQTIGVPFWMYGERLTGAVTVGATVLPVPVTDIPWARGDSVFLWLDPFTWEIQTFVSTAGGQVNCTAIGANWPAGTAVIPMRPGRLGVDAPYSWYNREGASSRLRFTIEAPGLTAPAGTAVGSLYLGTEVLDLTILDPNRASATDENTARKLAILDQLTGPVQMDPQAITPTPTSKILWTATSRAQAKLMADWIDARRGRAIPFWIPSYEADMNLAVDLASGGTIATVRWTGYHEYVWSKGFGRRHVAIHTPGFPLEYKAIVGSAHTPGSATQTITFSSGTARDYAAASTTIMFLRYSRLDSDDVRRTWLSNAVVEADIPLRELPIEEPV